MRRFAGLSLILGLGLSITLNFGSLPKAHADGFVDFPGSIPIHDERTGAADLVQDGRLLLPDEVLALKRSGVDVSRIDPDDSSDIWKNTPPQPLNPASYQLGIASTGDTFQYLSNVISRDGNFRFSVTRADSNGVVRTYTIMLSKRIHNVLLRKALLEKLGYRVPQIQVLRNFTVRFNGAFSRKQFLLDLNKKTFGDPERWVLNKSDQNADTALMQDAILLSGDDQIYNLALGSVPSPAVLGRRVMSSLLIPFNLTEVPESMNLFTWHSGRIINDTVFLPYEEADSLTPSIDDARWMARRVMSLSRNDWAEVVAAAGYPEPVARLALEKLISRRNTLIKLLELQATELPFNAKVSSGSLLKNGKLLQESWEGYGSRFAYGDPPSPLSPEEMRALGKSKIISNVIDNLIRQFNDNLRTDLSKVVYDHQVQMARERFINFLKTGKNEKVPFGVWAAPVISGNLIVSRDLVAGSYLGTDNVIQLADTFGYALEGGVFVGFDGLPAGVGVSGTAKLGLQRTYAHVKPVKSMQAAVKEPFKNVMVPLLKNDFGHTLDPVLGEFGGADPSSDQNAINETVKSLKDNLGVGESIIITDSLAGNAGLGASYGLADRVKLQGRINASEMVVRRLQIYRRDENTIQIYRDPATYNTLQASIGLDAVFQVMYLTVGRKAGEARTNFYSLNINPSLAENPDVVSNLKALRHLFLTNSTEAVDSLQKPFQIYHGFKEYSSELGIFFYRWLGLRSVDQIAVKHPDGYIKNFIYRMEGQRSGKNYEALATDVLNGLLEEITDSTNVAISPPDAVNPGDTLYGESVSRKATLEAETVRKGGREDIVENYIEVNYRYKGWKISRSGAEKLLKEISGRFGQTFYMPQALNNTKEIQLYSIDVNLSVYSDGIDYMSKIAEDRMYDLFKRYGKFPKAIGGGIFECRPGDERGRFCGSTYERQDYSDRQFKYKFFDAQARYRKALSRGDAMSATEAALQMVSVAEQIFPGPAFFKVVGGEQNVFIQSRMSGFRVGDEDMENALVSSTIGQIGSEKRSGPLRFIQQNLDMTESEFFIYWLLNKI